MEIALLEPRGEIVPSRDVFNEMIKERFFSEIKKRYESTRQQV